MVSRAHQSTLCTCCCIIVKFLDFDWACPLTELLKSLCFAAEKHTPLTTSVCVWICMLNHRVLTLFFERRCCWIYVVNVASEFIIHFSGTKVATINLTVHWSFGWPFLVILSSITFPTISPSFRSVMETAAPTSGRFTQLCILFAWLVLSLCILISSVPLMFTLPHNFECSVQIDCSSFKL